MAKCRVCKVKLNDENWYPSNRKRNQHICKGCENGRYRQWRQANPEKAKKLDRKPGARPYDENKECAQYLGVHVAERVMSHVFKDVERMPIRNPGFDFICNHGKKIDVKSSCLTGTKYPRWSFHIRRNTTADFFLCLAFDNREDLNPLHIWLIPGSVVNHHEKVSIGPSTVSKWSEYALDISKISECCVTMKENRVQSGAPD